jgi:hypothetical protein
MRSFRARHAGMNRSVLGGFIGENRSSKAARLLNSQGYSIRQMRTRRGRRAAFPISN